MKTLSLKKPLFSLGLDFGTQSARGILLHVSNGKIISEETYAYPHGVIDQFLPSPKKTHLPDEFALQHPLDYLQAFTFIARSLLKKSKIDPEQIIGIGIDFTSCTLLPVKKDGTPLCLLTPFQNDPQAWVKLWKHHAAQPQANRFLEIALKRKEKFIERYSQSISCEWFFPKALEIIEKSPAVYKACDQIIEAQDWLVWQLTGTEKRSACAAGYKAFWSKKRGFPSPNYFKEVHPKLENIISEKIGNIFYTPGEKAGLLTLDWAQRTGLSPKTAVAVSIIDAHSAVLGCGVAQPNEMVLCIGTSACHLIHHSKEKNVPGICGTVQDGILPNYFAYEAGQAAVGDLFEWFIKQIQYFQPHLHPKKIFEKLNQAAIKMKPNPTGLIALDWWNGNRSILANPSLRGVITGYHLSTQPHHIYRALLESTAMGSLKIIDSFEKHKISIQKLIVTGGIAQRNPLFMQILSDVIGKKITVPDYSEICARGAALLGAFAANAYPTLEQTTKKMTPQKNKIFSPNNKNHKIYKSIYKKYLKLHDYFGKNLNNSIGKK